jgi:hypothetical protein
MTLLLVPVAQASSAQAATAEAPGPDSSSKRSSSQPSAQAVGMAGRSTSGGRDTLALGLALEAVPEVEAAATTEDSGAGMVEVLARAQGDGALGWVKEGWATCALCTRVVSASRIPVPLVNLGLCWGTMSCWSVAIYLIHDMMLVDFRGREMNTRQLSLNS